MKNKDTKRVYFNYEAWETDEAAALLNKYSEEGWQLLRPRFIGATMQKDDSVVYRYQIDYKSKADQRYYETFSELGWQHVGEMMGYHYFRKVYDPEKSESEYEIYTDDESYRQSVRGRARTYLFLAITWGLLTIPYFMNAFMGNNFYFYIAALYLFCTAIYTFTAVSLYRKMKDRILVRAGADRQLFGE